jgi:hypothetical protein
MAIDTQTLAAFVAHNAELGRDECLFATSLDRFAHQHLIRPWTVHVRRIEKSRARIERSSDDADTGIFIGSIRGVEVRQSHASEPECRNLWAVATKLRCFHRSAPALKYGCIIRPDVLKKNPTKPHTL